MGEKEIMTVDDLLNLFQTLSEAGMGDVKIRCTDGFLHRDEITVSHLDNEVWFRGFLFNQPISDKIREFCRDIEKAKQKFFDSEVTE